jgi:UDP-N-acetylmuramoylalanine--D-glutamate ligase
MDVTSLRRGDPWSDVRVLVVGFDADGQSAADNLLHLGAEVAVLDPVARPDTAEFAELLSVLGADILRGEGAEEPGIEWLAGRGWRLIIATAEAAAHRVFKSVRELYPDASVMSSLDLARQFEPDQAWLLIGAAYTGDSLAEQIARGTTAMLRTAGVSAAPAGAGERTAMELVMEPDRYDALVVVVTPEVLALTGALRPQSSCVLIGREELASAFTDVERACVYKPEEPATEDMVREADVVEGARAIGITRGTPGVGMLGVVEDVLCDRAFVEDRHTTAAEICTLSDLKRQDDDYVEAILASVALACAYGVALPLIRTAIGETF